LIGTANYTFEDDRLLTVAGAYIITRNVGNGLPKSVSGGGFSQSRGFNGYREMDSQDTAAGGVTHNYSYIYDAAGRLLAMNRDVALVEEYDYNAIGTRIYEMNSLRGITGRDYDFDAEDHLLTADAVTYSYDFDGFLSAKTEGANVTTYDYSSQGELLGVNLPDGRVVEYVHDPLRRRVAKIIDGVVVEKYLWQGLTRLLAGYNSTDSLVQRFEYTDGRLPVAMTMSGARYFLTYDQVGSLRAVADGADNVVMMIALDSFGNVFFDTDPGFFSI
jgi:YD repeat-containing protein